MPTPKPSPSDRSPARRETPSPTLSPGYRARRRPRRPPPADAPNGEQHPVVREIIVAFDEDAVANAGIEALASCPELFTHSGRLVSLVPCSIPGTALDRSARPLRIERLPTPRLRELLSRSARWLMTPSDRPGDHIVSQVPQRIVAGIGARSEWPGLRPLAGLVVTPVLRPDGTVLQTPGYDPETGLFLAPNAVYPLINAEPTRSDAHAAAEVLLGTVRDVPFATPADQSAWLAMVATIFARFAVGAASPLCVVEGALMTRWADDLVDHTANIVGTDRVASVDAAKFVAAPRRLLDLLLANGESLGLLNNVTSQKPTAWRRLREALQREHATNGVVWCAAIIRATRDLELARTGLSIRCEGTGFPTSRDDPDSTAGRSHGDSSPRLVVAVLTMLLAYQAAGSPDVHLPRWPGFERWSRFVRSAVVWCGYTDPVATDIVAEAPTLATDASIEDLVQGWAELVKDFPGGCSARQALDALSREPSTKYPRLRAALTVFAPGPLNDRSTADRLGHSLKRFSNSNYGGYALVFVTSGNQGNRWTVRSTASSAGR